MSYADDRPWPWGYVIADADTGKLFSTARWGFDPGNDVQRAKARELADKERDRLAGGYGEEFCLEVWESDAFGAIHPPDASRQAKARPAPEPAERPSILPMQVDVESIVATLILRSATTHRATKRAIVLSYFATEDQEKVAVVVDRKLDEAEARRRGRVGA